MHKASVIWESLAIATLPVLFFFTFLFYTDPGSVFFTLLTYYLHLRGCRWLSALAGAMAVLFRQTNVVWVGFCVLEVISEEVAVFVQRHRLKNESTPKPTQLSFILHCVRVLLLRAKLSDLLWFCVRLLHLAAPHLLVCCGFVAFVLYNGSIVVGAKTDHQAALHFAQVYYFAAFCVASSVSHHASVQNVARFLNFLRSNILTVLTFIVVSAWLLWNFSFAHRYLISDNRHYTFYIWSKILNRHPLARVALIPAYLFAFWCVNVGLAHKSVLWRAAYFLCVVVTLVPSPLLELRYFIAPYLFWRLSGNFSSKLPLYIELVLNLLINALTLHVFIFKTFSWPDSDDLQRFMW